MNQIDESAMLVSVNVRGVATLRQQAAMNEAVRKLYTNADELLTEEEVRQRRHEDLRWKQLIEFSDSQRKKGFSAIHNPAVVFEWGIFEAAFEDFVVAWLDNVPGALAAERLPRVRVDLAEFEIMGREERMRYVYRQLEQASNFASSPGVAGYERLLSYFDLSGPVSDELRRNLIEMACVRNVITHRASIADRRIVQLCPWMELSIGDEVNVSTDQYRKYHTSLVAYTADLLTRVADRVNEASWNDESKANSSLNRCES